MPEPFQLSSQIHNDSIPNSYPLDIDANKSHSGIFSASFGNGDIKVFDVNNSTLQDSTTVWSCSSSIISQIKWDPNAPFMIWAATKDSAAVFAIDTRTAPNCKALDLSLQSKENVPISFDVSNTGVLAVGTELASYEAPLFFFDQRQPGVELKRFQDVHSDDITQVRFHPTDSNALITGSTDGLVNLYNLQEQEEDDALYQVIKDTSISKIGFFGPCYEYIYCSTHIETISLYSFQDAQKIIQFGDVRGVSPELSLDYCIDWTFDHRSNHLFLHAGSRDGNIGILNVSLSGLQVAMTLNGGHSDIIRCNHWIPERGIYISGGEDGLLNLWQQAL